jgi:hypothetical protein
VITIREEITKVNPYSTLVFVSTAARFLNKSYEDHIRALVEHTSLTTEDMDYLVIYSSKLRTLSEYFHPAVQCKDDDLIFLPRTHTRW